MAWWCSVLNPGPNSSRDIIVMYTSYPKPIDPNYPLQAHLEVLLDNIKRINHQIKQTSQNIS